ncbi:MAG TPA: chemotaxis protein CheW [Myxococcaceae bacterium]|nr:chemotaxis protein CheW [Myxococcaceae bacterium]
MSSDPEGVDVCAFWVGEAVYGIDVARVDEILPRVVPLPVSDAPAHVEGVVHVHGTAVPIVDLRRLLPAGNPPRTAKPKVILARIGRRRVGLRVDGMAGVRRYTAAEIRPGATVPGVLGETGDECRLLDLQGLLANRSAGPRAGL